MGLVARWTCVGTLFLFGSLLLADSTVVPGRSRQGDLDAREHLQAVHAEMQHECGVSPGSPRCHQLKREFRQEARNYRRRHNR